MAYYDRQEECGGYAKDKFEKKEFCCEVHIKIRNCDKYKKVWDPKSECECDDKKEFFEDKKECRPKVFVDVKCPCEDKKHGKNCEDCNILVDVDFCKDEKKCD